MRDESGSSLILLVDDFEDAREMYAEYLSFRGYRIVTAASGAEALRVAHLPDRPTLILMDIRMLGMDGTAAMQSLRLEPAFAGVPIIAFTAHALRSEHDAALLAGFDAVIAKPCLPDELVTLIQPFLGPTRNASA
jgi:two-component system, cell cycle response regulator DivK